MEIPSVISIVDKSTTFYKELLRLSKEVKPYLHNKGDPILIGARHSDLLVVQILEIRKDRRAVYCKCDCGNFIRISYSNFKNHNNRNCGCKPHGYKHGESKDRLYGIWQNMNYRCCNPNDDSYENYGAKGISVCTDWNIDNKNGFVNFSKWAHSNGYNEKLTIDRIDETKPYCQENCRWATYLEQNTHLGMLKTNKSGYKGVSWDKVNNQWLVVISINNKTHHIGRYNTKKQAVEARNNYIDRNNLLHKKQKYIGEDGYINGYSY